MPFDSDVALLGTGVAPLVAASHLMAQGKTVLLLNPDFDFFLEDSELPLDPLWPLSRTNLSPARLLRSAPENALAELRPVFPGAVESWSEQSSETGGYRDAGAPHVRQRARLFVVPADGSSDLEMIEDAYVEASDAGLNPQLVEGLAAAARFPGYSGKPTDPMAWRGLAISRLSDVDVGRFRSGLLEFVRERLGPERVVCDASQIEIMPGGVRFHARQTPSTARLREGMLVFWTPRLSQWLAAQAKKAEVTLPQPRGVRLWEQWTLVSRDPLDPGIAGNFRGLTVWADVEGAPSRTAPLHSLSVLRAGPLAPEQSWLSSGSFQDLSALCHGFLKWSQFTVRAMRPRTIFEWENEDVLLLSREEPRVQVFTGCDGPLIDVVRIAREACDRLEMDEIRRTQG